MSTEPSKISIMYRKKGCREKAIYLLIPLAEWMATSILDGVFKVFGLYWKFPWLTLLGETGLKALLKSNHQKLAFKLIMKEKEGN